MRSMDGSRREWVKAIRLGIAAALIVIGILTIAGCIYIPVPEHPSTLSGRDVRQVVGDPGSNKPLWVGMVSRDTVLNFLGPPSLRTAHDAAIGYDCQTLAGHYFGLCVIQNKEREVTGPFNSPANVWAHHVLLMEFDQNGLLKRYQLSRIKYGGWKVEPAWKEFVRSVGDEPTEPAAAGGR